jgi:hypothetical protein
MTQAAQLASFGQLVTANTVANSVTMSGNISYQNTTQIGSGGTVTSYSSSGLTYWVHTFNSSGTYTA